MTASGAACPRPCDDFIAEHEAEAAKRKARITNLGWATTQEGDNFDNPDTAKIKRGGTASKTTKGILESRYRNGKVTHMWHANVHRA